MCGRFTITVTMDELKAYLNDYYDIEDMKSDIIVPRYNVSPGQDVISIINDGTKNRMILEYSKKVSTNITYNSKEEYIVFDHLEPLEGAQKGMFDFYVPSLSFDGLTFKNGKWRFVEDVAIFNSKDQDVKQDRNIEQGLQRQ